MLMDKDEKFTAKSPEEERTEAQGPQIIGVTSQGNNNNATIPEVLPIVPMRGTVVFPGTVIPLSSCSPWPLRAPPSCWSSALAGAAVSPACCWDR